MNQIDEENFNEFGTLLSFRDVIYHLKEKEGKIRGGFFLCIPNFEEDKNIFEIKHGEYRKTKDVYFGDKKLLEGKWGKIKVEKQWTESDNSLKVDTTISSLQNETYLRPGFHPYFFVGNDFQININNKSIYKKDLPDDTLIIFKGNEGELITNNKTIKINIDTYNKDISFGVWSDNKEKYVCIEPIIGEGYDENNLPKPFKVHEDEEIKISCQITYY